MKKITLYLLVVLGLPLFFARAEVIRLKNGVELHCEILDCSEENGLKVKRLDNGGIIELRWEHILVEDVMAIKYARGYTNEEAKPVQIRVKRVWLKNGTFEDGLMVESENPGSLLLRRKGKLYPISKHLVRDIENVDVEAKEIYTMEELYLQKIEEGAPETVSDFFALGVYLESVTYYEKALDIYELILEEDPEYKPDVISRKILVMGAKIKEADATAMLDEAKHLLYRNKFELALNRIAEFEELFPDSIQMGDKEELKSEIYTKRHTYYGKRILTDYFTCMGDVAYKVAAYRDDSLLSSTGDGESDTGSEKKISLEAAMDFASEAMGPAIRKALAGSFKIPEEEVEELWQNRKGGAPRTYSYGTGTFILGPDKAKLIPETSGSAAEEKKEEEEEKPQTLDERLKKRIEDLRKEKEKFKGKRKSSVRIEEIGLTPDEWWARESINNRKHFLISFYAEESSDMNILRVRLNPCRACHGKRWHEQISTTGEEDQKIPCEVCKTLGIERIVIFK